MNKDLEKDLLKTHGIINYIHAEQQGKLTYLKTLMQLGELVNPDEMSRNQSAADRINGWLKLLWREEPLFSHTWTKPETFDSQKALDYMDQLVADLEMLSTKIIGVLSENKDLRDPKDAALAIAAALRLAYTRDAYMRGFIDFGKRFQKSDMVIEYSGLLPSVADEIASAHTLLNAYRQEPNQGEAFFSQLRYRAMALPAAFRMHVHDMLQISLPYKGLPLDYDKFGIAEDRAELWKKLGVNPVLAGYWEAHFIHPELAAAWGASGITDFNLAGRWRLHGFEAPDAKPWIDEDITPFDALLWRTAGFSAREARTNLDQGIVDPSQAEKPRR